MKLPRISRTSPRVQNQVCQLANYVLPSGLIYHCRIAGHCGNGEFTQGHGYHEIEEQAQLNAYDEVKAYCNSNRQGLLSTAGDYCTRDFE